MAERICSIPDCGRPHKARGYCDMHWKQRRQAGLLEILTPLSPQERFWTKVAKGDNCWLWMQGKSAGYGRFNLWRGPSHSVLAHRYAWELTYGPIPDDLPVLHRCDNPPCVRPDHLFLGTQADNLRDMHTKNRQAGPPAVNARKTRCIHGHPFDATNTAMLPNGHRRCRACHRQRTRERRSQAAEDDRDRLSKTGMWHVDHALLTFKVCSSPESLLKSVRMERMLKSVFSASPSGSCRVTRSPSCNLGSPTRGIS